MAAVLCKHMPAYIMLECCEWDFFGGLSGLRGLLYKSVNDDRISISWRSLQNQDENQEHSSRAIDL